MKYYIIFLFSFFFIVKKGVAQELQATKNGEFIVVLPDGAWANYDPSIAFHKSLMKKYKQKKKDEKKAADLAEKEAKKGKGGNQKKIINDHLKTLDEEKTKGQLADKAILNRKEKEAQMANLKKIAFNKNNQDIKNMSKLISEAKDEEKKAISAFKSVNKDAKKARIALTKLNVEHSLYPPYQLALNQVVTPDNIPITVVDSNGNVSQEIEYLDNTVPSGAATTAPKLVEKEKKKGKENKKESKKEEKRESKKEEKKEKDKTVVVVKAENEKPTKKPKVLLPENDVMENPPPAPCRVAYEGADEFSGKKRKELAAVPLFQYTDETVKKYYEGEDFLTCEVNFSTAEGTGYKYLTFTFIFASDNVGTSYGWIEKDNLLSIRLIGGETLNLYNSRTDRGMIDNVNRRTTYKAICLIGAGEEKTLAKAEVDAIRVMWSTGTEDYDIYDVDIFADQLKCLNKK